MQRLLLTGASGFLGGALRPVLGQRYAVVPVSRQPRDGWQAVDLTEAATVRHMIATMQPAVVVHAAALTAVDACERDQPQAYLQNVRATENLAAACAALPMPAKFVYISTDHMYDGPGPHSEDGPVRPLNVYALTKLWAEDIARRVPGALILRSNFIGLGDRPGQGLAGWLLKAIAERQPLTLFTDVLFNPLYLGDYADLLVDLLDSDADGVVNLGAAGGGMSKADFAAALAQQFDLTIAAATLASVDSLALPARRPKDMRMNVDRLQRLLPGRAVPTVESGLRRMRRDADRHNAAQAAP